MNLKEIISGVRIFAENFQIPLSEIRVTHGCAMVFLGIQSKTSDIDVVVSEHAFQQLIDLGYPVIEALNGFKRIQMNGHDIYKEYLPDHGHVTDHPNLHGIRYESAMQTVEQYKQLHAVTGHAKYLAKISLLENHINNAA